MSSLPSRGRGLKSVLFYIGQLNSDVAPFTGAWIEIRYYSCEYNRPYVAPFTGAWIEIRFFVSTLVSRIVVPFTGAWIEIS